MTTGDISVDKNLIFDVGMHRGEDTEYYLKRGFRVVGFEANPDLVRDNSKVFAKEIEQGNLIIIEGAIVDDPSIGSIKFYVNEDSSVWGTIHAEFAERNEMLGTSNKVVEVKAIDFVDCIKKNGLPYYMKIDIEGADLCCLRALKHFANKPYYISIESEKVEFEGLLHEIELLDELGYNNFKAVQQANVPHMRVPSNSQEGTIVNHVFSKEASGLFGSDTPGKWLNKDELIERYKTIFREYSRYGDNTIWQRNPVARLALKALSRLTGNHYPGWYDTHARHVSATSQGAV